jgi:ATP-dependent Zn protease
MADIDVSMGGKVAEEIIFGPDQVCIITTAVHHHHCCAFPLCPGSDGSI